MRINIESLADIYGGNQSLGLTAQWPESTLEKKHNATIFLGIRKAITTGIQLVAKEATESNLADLLTKCIGTFKQRKLLKWILW